MQRLAMHTQPASHAMVLRDDDHTIDHCSAQAVEGAPVCTVEPHVGLM